MSKLAPTLIVGLGGRGSEIVSMVAKMITEKQRERISFVVLDTDVNELNHIKAENSFIRTVQTSTNMTVGDYLHLDEYTRDNSFPVNPNLYRKTLTEGAGQVRAISHLAFVTAMKRGEMEELDKAIYDLYKLESEPSVQALRIIIVSTLAGGTGSGLILPISMYIKQFLKTRIQIPGSITRGFFILPEILYGAVTAEPMRNAFKSNAYAVLRELNAFILKADNNLPERYRDKVHLKFPKIGTSEFEEYDVLPMDFCFMFDAQNVEGKQLNSTQQYLEHAATCIYAQSIGPMNTRSNSSEDNTIRTLVSGQSRNRYAGAGASELVYPSDHIIRYIALRWAAHTVTEHWTVFDKIYKKQSLENNRARLKGHGVQEIKWETEYINSVDGLADKGDNPFAMSVKNASYFLDKDGFTITGNKWKNYITALYEFVKQRSTSGQSEIDNSQISAQSAVEALSAESKTDMFIFRNAYNFLLSYKELVSRRIGEIGRVASYALFKSDEDGIFGDNPNQIESYMWDNSKEFMHPNAVRYFLYQTLLELEKKSRDVEKQNERDKEAFKSFDTMFADDTDDSIRNIGDFQRVYDDRNFWERWSKKYESDLNSFKERYESILETVARYRVNAPFAVVLTEAIKYVRNLCGAFESFYTSFDASVSDLNRKISSTRDKYSLEKGNTIRYVCASPKCLDKFYEKMEFSGNALQLSSELCIDIYRQVKRISLTTEAKANTFFTDIFDNVILKHFKDSVATNYGRDIKMDIISAMQVEADYEKDIKEHSHVINYVKKVIKDTKKLADPFINRPIGEAPVIIPACAYNKNLITDNPERNNLILSELKSFGGVSCDNDEINPERILFYSAIYGLFPYDLLRFSPPQKSKTKNDGAGEYFRSYFDMVNRIEPDTLTTPVITPHIHKHWHLISEMPDLNDTLQKEQERAIYKALVLGLLYERILYEKNGEKYKYTLWLNSNNKEIKLVTLDGLPCNYFYQVVEALTINPVIVKMILSAIDIEMETERRNNKIRYEESVLCAGIKNLTLRELSNDNRPMSIFGFAAAYKAKMPPDKFILDQGLMLLEVTLETLYEQLQLLCPENERGVCFINIINEQLKLFTSNFDFYKKEHRSVIDDYLRELLHVVINVLTDKGFIDASKKVKELIKKEFCDDTQEMMKPNKKNDEKKDQ